jgi:hypothetical protein
MVGTEDAPSDLLRERVGASRLKLWLLLEADRRLVTGVLSIAVFVVLVGAGSISPIAERALRAGDSVDTLFQALLTATITGVTLVLTLNQLVLSQELGAVGDQRERMEAAMQFRRDVADAIGTPVSPSHPAQFLRALVQVAGERAETLRDAVSDADDETLQTSVESFAADIASNADQVAAGLDGAKFGEFDVVSSALNFNYSRKIFTARRIRERHGAALDGAGTAALDELIELLRLFGPTREHFKTLYFQWELINLSQRILTASIPALLVSTSMIAFFDAETYGAVGFDPVTLVVAVAAATTVTVFPFLLLLSYIMRIATVAKHTLSIGPFVLRGTDATREVEWNR